MSLVCIHVFTVSSRLLSLVRTRLHCSHHFLLAQNISFDASCSAGVLVMSSLIFCLKKSWFHLQFWRISSPDMDIVVGNFHTWEIASSSAGSRAFQRQVNLRGASVGLSLYSCCFEFVKLFSLWTWGSPHAWNIFGHYFVKHLLSPLPPPPGLWSYVMLGRC